MSKRKATFGRTRAMAYGIVLEFVDVGKDQYDAVNEELGLHVATGRGDWPAGLTSHAAGPTATGWVVSEVWSSKASQEAWMAGRLGAALGAVGIPAPVHVCESELVAYRTF
jgi:hypothetical protein